MVRLTINGFHLVRPCLDRRWMRCTIGKEAQDILIDSRLQVTGTRLRDGYRLTIRGENYDGKLGYYSITIRHAPQEAYDGVDNWVRQMKEIRNRA